MAVTGTSGNDTYANPNVYGWDDYYALAGDDTVRMYSWRVFPGPGNDLIERLEPETGYVYLWVSYFEDPGPVAVDLEAGWAHDGWGGADTLINVTWIEGSGYGGTYYGSSYDDHIQVHGLANFVDGSGGTDLVVLSGDFYGAPTDLIITGSLDGADIVLTGPNPGARLELHNVEYIGQQGHWNWVDPIIAVADLIAPYRLATEGLVMSVEQRWNSGTPLGTAVSISLGFFESTPSGGPGADGFRIFTAEERIAVRGILQDVAAVTGLSFVEATDGQMRFGVSQQAATKGIAFAPTAAGAGDAGDVWMDVESMINLQVGSEGYAALLHEIGHALGLGHPDLLSEVHAVSTTTVMASEGVMDDLYRGDWGPLDVAALRYLYGSEATNLGNSVHHIGGDDAPWQRTIIDDGGHDTLDASDSSVGVAIDLRPFRNSSAGVTIEGLPARDNVNLGIDSWIEDAVGSSQDDLLYGNSLANRIAGKEGNDWIDGREGVDTAVFDGLHSSFTVSRVFDTIEVLGLASGLDVLVSVERLEFSDISIALDLGVTQSAGGTVLLLGTVLPGLLAMDPSKQALLGSVIDLFDAGYSLRDLSGAASRLPIWGILTGQATPANTDIASYLLTNVNGQAPDAAALAEAVNALNTESFQGDWLASLASSLAGQAHISLVGLQQTGLEYV